MSGSPQVTNPSALNKGSLGKQVGLSIITLGLYTLYWTYSTAQQLDQATDQNLTPIFGVIPLLNLVAFWQISNASEAVTDQSGTVLFLVFLVFSPLSWYWVQSGINGSAAN